MAQAPLPAQRHRRRPAVPAAARKRFLEAVGQAWSVTHAAALVGVHRRRLYELRDSDEEFARAWAEAYDAGTDAIRDEIRRRAVEGWEEPVYQRGELVGHIRKFDSRLLELEAKRRDPSYRENARVEVTGKDGGPVELSGEGRTSLADVIRLAGEYGVLDQVGLRLADVVDGEAVEVEPLGLPGGEAA